MKQEVTILSIDDEEAICFALCELFRFQGWRALSANNVKDGLGVFAENPVDIVLIDYHMPGINGIDGVLQLRRLSADVPIIVFTIDERQELADRFLEAGASDFALKPIKAADIVSRIRLHLRLLEQKSQIPDSIVAAKGINASTLELITATLAAGGACMTAKQIAEESGLAYQTVYRYLQHLVKENRVSILNHYGKIGLPRQVYSLCQ